MSSSGVLLKLTVMNGEVRSVIWAKAERRNDTEITINMFIVAFLDKKVKQKGNYYLIRAWTISEQAWGWEAITTRGSAIKTNSHKRCMWESNEEKHLNKSMSNTDANIILENGDTFELLTLGDGEEFSKVFPWWFGMWT